MESKNVKRYIIVESKNGVYMNNIGCMYDDLGDLDNAYIWYMKAYKDGCFISIGGIGSVLQRKDNIKEARIWYKKGADLGDIKCMNNLATTYSGEDKFYKYKWYRKAVELGSDIAIFNLSWLLAENEDTEELKIWSRKFEELKL